VSYVPQRESVDWDYPASVFDVALMGRYGRLGLFRRPGKADREIAREALAAVEMTAYADRQIGRLSGGQRQRVFLARALAQQADLYLMDEPFAGVDMATELALMNLLQKLKSEGKTVVVVHHDLQTAGEYFDWVLLLNQTIYSIGPTEEVFTLENLQNTYGGRLSSLVQLAKRFSQA
jgi:manganese/zinc/iron transport system ATP- binding protein